jgi:hypothetical protein
MIRPAKTPERARTTNEVSHQDNRLRVGLLYRFTQAHGPFGQILIRSIVIVECDPCPATADSFFKQF